MLNIKLVKLIQTCYACPSQWDAWDEEGNQYYIRYRGGTLRVDKGGCRGETILEKDIGGGLDGFLNEGEMLEFTGFIFSGESQ